MYPKNTGDNHIYNLFCTNSAIKTLYCHFCKTNKQKKKPIYHLEKKYREKKKRLQSIMLNSKQVNAYTASGIYSSSCILSIIITV